MQVNLTKSIQKKKAGEGREEPQTNKNKDMLTVAHPFSKFVCVYRDFPLLISELFRVSEAS